MSFETILYNRMNTAAGSYMDGKFSGSASALTAFSEDIGVDARTSQGLLNIFGRRVRPARAKRKSIISRLLTGKASSRRDRDPDIQTVTDRSFFISGIKTMR